MPQHTKKADFTREQPMHPPKLPKSPSLCNRSSQPFSDHVPLTEFFTEFLEFRSYKGRLNYNVSKLICSKCTINVPFQIGKCTPRGTCIPVWEPVLRNLFITLHCVWIGMQTVLMNLKCNVQRYFNYHVTVVETFIKCNIYCNAHG